jgi:DNA processing protein
MDSDHIAAALTLLALPRAGASAVNRMLDATGDPCQALRLPAPMLTTLGLHPDTVSAHAACRGLPSTQALRQRDWLLGSDVQVLPRNCEEYPGLLLQIARPPPFLFLKGSAAAIRLPQVAVVGSRKPTPAGREFAADLAAGLVRYGLAVTSGLARGIDTAAHGGALFGGGITVAVMGTGPDRVYPASNRELAACVLASGGALLTEYPPGVPPEAAHFPQRNRLISGLGLGVVVVEAALPSGSLSTATHAAEQGREVMSVPGPVRSPTSRGCHELLRNGAALIETPEDVIRALGDRFKPRAVVSPGPASAPSADPRELGEQAQQVFAATSTLPAGIDLLVSRCGLPVAEVSAAVVLLELAGLLESTPAGVARLR